MHNSGNVSFLYLYDLDIFSLGCTSFLHINISIRFDKGVRTIDYFQRSDIDFTHIVWNMQITQLTEYARKLSQLIYFQIRLGNVD